MKRNLLPVTFIVFFCAFIMGIPDAGAVGLGLYGNFSQGTMSATAEGSYNGNDYNHDFDSNISGFGVGFVIDSCVARKSLFNYRLQIGYEKLTHSVDMEQGGDSDLDLAGFAFTQDFGFGIVKTSFMRLWLGPELRIAYGMGDYDDRSDWQAFLLDFGIGPALGANFHLGPSPVTLAVKVSYLFEGYIGASIYDGPADFDDEVLSGSGSSLYVTFSVLFRIADRY